MSEIFDVFDASMNPVAPFQADRDDVHKKGLWHQTFHCWILNKGDNGPQIILQLRGQTIQFPKTFDISAAGHLAAGETPLDGVREVEEELGISIDPKKLLSLGIYQQATDDHARQYFNREFCHTYFYETDKGLSDFIPQQSEVDGVFEISLHDGLRLFGEEMDSVDIKGRKLENGIYVPITHRLTREQMCGFRSRCQLSRYYLKVFLLTDLYFQGRRNLSI